MTFSGKFADPTVMAVPALPPDEAADALDELPEPLRLFELEQPASASDAVAITAAARMPLRDTDMCVQFPSEMGAPLGAVRMRLPRAVVLPSVSRDTPRGTVKR